MKSQSYQKFWQKIHQTARKQGFPLGVMFELTYRCNFRCRHCYVPFSYRGKGELKTQEVFSVLDQLKDLGCFYLGFTGGEPFMRTDILDILWYAKRCGFEIIIYTNGSLINERIAGELARLRPNKVDITIPAMTEKAFCKITLAHSAHKQVFRAIELLSKKGVALGFKTCVLKQNQDQIKDIRNFAQSLGALHRLDDMLSPRLDGSKAPYRYRGRLDLGRTSHVTRNTSRISNGELQTALNSDRPDTCYLLPDTDTQGFNLFKCGVGISQVAITPLGELKPCLMIDYPRFKILETARHTLHANGLEEAWKRLKAEISSINLDGNYQCNNCNLKPYCKWCPARGWLHNRSFTSCEPENRQKAEAARQLINCHTAKPPATNHWRGGSPKFLWRPQNNRKIAKL